MDHLASLSAIILDAALKATVLLALAWAGGLLLRHRSAAARHMLRTFVLAVLLLLPFSGLLPAWHLRGIPTFTAAPSAVQTLSQATPAQGSSANAPTEPRTVAAKKARALQKPAGGKAITREEQVGAAQGRMGSTTAATSAPLETKLKTTKSIDWLRAITMVWMLGVGFFGLRWTLSLVRLWRLVRGAELVGDAGWTEQAGAVARSLELRRGIALLESKETEVPLATGLVYPKVIFPPDYREWSQVRRGAVLYHEMAHIKRCDALTHIVAEAALVLYWFHPMAWLTVRAMRSERERACDDQVLAAGTKASDYAHELLDIVSNLRQPALAGALAMARRSQLEGRVLAVLNPALRRGSVSRRTALAAAAVVLLVAVPIAAVRPAEPASIPVAASGESSTTYAESRAGMRDAFPASTSGQLLVATLDEPLIKDVPPALRPEINKINRAVKGLNALLQQEQDGDPGALLRAQTPALLELKGRLSELDGHLFNSDLFGLRDRVTLMRQETEAMLSGDWPPTRLVASTRASEPPPATQPSAASPTLIAGDDIGVCGSKAKMHNMSINSHDGHKNWTASWSGDDCSVELRAEGDIQFNADANEIQSISSGGYFEVNVREGASLRQVRVTPSGNGVQYALKLNGKEQPYDSDSKAWFAGFLLSLERATGFAADTRVPKLLAKGGPTAVLDEINNLQGDYVRGIYFRKLLDQPNLPSAVVIRIIKQSGEQIESDYEKARVLMEVSKQYELADESSRTTFLDAAGKLQSDYEHARVLMALLQRPNISAANVRAALDSASTIKSDYEKSRILLSLIEQKSFQQSYLDSYLKLVANITSDYEKSRDLLAPLQRYPLTSAQVDQIIDAATRISSDYEKARLITTLANTGKFDENQMSNYLKVVASIASDYERGRSLTTLMERNKLSDASLARVIEATSHITRDYEKARVLVAVAGKYQLQGTLRESYIKAAESIGSEVDRNRALAGVVKRATL